jgi:2-polyprenyl-3-methyl-5-hydroxy-6-metoxy-1,4-benzoquinol methylase
MKQRSREPELIDLGFKYYSIEEYNQCLYQLGRIGKYLGTDKSMIKLFSKMNQPINSILDVGCGSGAFTRQLAEKFQDTQVVGTDICAEAISYAQNQKEIYQSKKNLDNLKFELRFDAELNEPEKSFDIVTSTLVFHHLSNENIITFLKKSKLIARKAIIINDLHRNWLPYMSCKVLMPLFFPNRLVCNDSLLSIKKSFTYDDWKYYLYKAGFNNKDYKISWYWPFRWIVEIKI